MTLLLSPVGGVDQKLWKSTNTISKKLGYRLSPQSSLKLRPLERGALVDRCVAPVDRNGIIHL
jgi:hypothetical protein